MADNLTSRGARANTPALLPALPASTATEPARRQWEEQVREWLEVRLGARGDRFERAVTFRDLDPVVADIGQRLLALENESAASVEDCCKQLRSQLSAIWAAIYLLRADVDLLDVVARKRVLEVKDIVVDPSAPTGDIYYSYVSLLLHMDGATGSTSFPDSSSYVHTVTPHGGAQITVDANAFGSASGVFDGAGDYLSVATHTSHQFGSGDFTIEYWLDGYTWNSAGVVNPHIAMWKTGSNGLSWLMGTELSNQLAFYYSVDGNTGVFTAVTTGYNVSQSSRIHLAATRASGVLRLFIHGIKRYEGTHNVTFYAPSSTPLTVAGVDYSAPMLASRMDEVRVTKDIARYTADFVPPTEPFSTSPTTTIGGNALLLESNAYTTVVDPASPTSVTDIRSATFSASSPQVGIAHLSSPNGENTQIARSGKRYFEIRNGSGRMFIGFLANSGFTSNYPTTRDPFGTTGYYCITNIDYRSRSAGLITNGTASTNSSYAWNWGTPVNVGTNTYDMIGVAVDFATGKVWFSKAGTWISGDPAAGTSPTFTLPDANFTPVIGAYPDTGVTPTALICPRAGTTVSLPPTGFTWYA